MNEKRIMDKNVEEMMKVIAETLIESRGEYADRILGNLTQNAQANESKDDAFVAMEVHPDAKKRNRRWSIKVLIKRAGIMVAILVLTMGLFLSVSEAARRYLYNAIFEEEKDHYVVVFGPDDKEAPVYKEFVVTYVPEGFERVYHESSYIENKGGAGFYEEYAFGDKFLNIEIMPRQYYQIVIDNENMAKRKVEFDGIEGYYFYDDSYTLLLWSDGRYEFKLSGSLDVDEYIDVSRGLKGIE